MFDARSLLPFPLPILNHLCLPPRVHRQPVNPLRIAQDRAAKQKLKILGSKLKDLEELRDLLDELRRTSWEKFKEPLVVLEDLLEEP